MKQTFLWIIAILGVIAILGYLGWRVIQAFASMGEDWKAGRETAEMQAQKEELEKKRGEDNAKRLDNGCEHQFDEMFGRFPPGVCRKCGLEEKRPGGICDHTWRKLDGPVPGSRCEQCGKQHGGAQGAART